MLRQLKSYVQIMQRVEDMILGCIKSQRLELNQVQILK